MLTSPYDADSFSRDIVTFIFHFVKMLALLATSLFFQVPESTLQQLIMLTSDVMFFARHNPSL